jgi:hypothetical protein
MGLCVTRLFQVKTGMGLGYLNGIQHAWLHGADPGEIMRIHKVHHSSLLLVFLSLSPPPLVAVIVAHQYAVPGPTQARPEA